MNLVAHPIFQSADQGLDDSFRFVLGPKDFGCHEHPDQIFYPPDHLEVVETGFDLHGKEPRVYSSFAVKTVISDVVAEILNEIKRP